MTTWQDKRINAMNRKMARQGTHLHDRYIDEHFSVINSNAKNKKEYKLERKKNEKANTTNVSSD